MRASKFLATLWAAVLLALFNPVFATSIWAAEYKVLYKFKGDADGQYPYAGLIFDAAGNLYGTTVDGGDGSYGYGTVFKLVPNPDGSWTHIVIHGFSGRDGWAPAADVIFDVAGNLYGTTVIGGAYWDFGTVFKLAPNPDGSWTESVMHSFGGEDGDRPRANLIFDSGGNLYGTTARGGAYDYYGTVFRLTPNPDGSWTHGVIHSFDGADGNGPWSGVIFDAAGNLYGTTAFGGVYDLGTVFSLAPNPDGSWTWSRLHSFKGRDGAYPHAGLVFDTAGNLYGTTASGGAYDSGTVFKLAPQPDGHWRLSKLHVFKHRQIPSTGLAMDAAGNLYGATIGGGLGYGVVFKITP